MSLSGYSILHWGSHPDQDNDDCYTGSDFATKEEALLDFAVNAGCEIEYIEIDGPDIHEIRKNPNYSKREVRLDDPTWRNERAMQAGMAGGCEAYNEEMGYD